MLNNRIRFKLTAIFVMFVMAANIFLVPVYAITNAIAITANEQSAWTNGSVTINTSITDTQGNIISQLWAAGSQTVDYFGLNGTIFSGNSFTVTANGVYTVFAKDDVGNTAVQTVVVNKQDTETPSIPANLTIQSKTDNNITLTWDYSTDNVGVSGYYIFRNDILIQSSSTNSFTDAGLMQGTVYAYSIQSYDAAGNMSSKSPEIVTSTNIVEFSDNFDSGKSPQWIDYGIATTVNNGQLNLPSSSGGKAAISQTFTNYDYDCDITPTSIGGDCGLIFNVVNLAVGPDSLKGYYVGLKPGKGTVVLGLENYGFTLLKSASYTVNCNTTYHVRVSIRGYNIKIYINDMSSPLFNINNDMYSNGTVGVRDYSSSAKFDNVKVTPVPYTPNVPMPVYSNDFSSGTKSDWTEYGTPGSIVNGEYNLPNSSGCSAIVNNDSYTNFIYTADVKIISGSGFAGLIFRATNPSSYSGYSIRINSASSKVELGKSVNTSWTELASVPMTISTNVFYHFKLVVNGPSIKFYLNNMDSPIINIVDSSYITGEVGVRAVNVNVHYDNINIINTEPTTLGSFDSVPFNANLTLQSQTNDGIMLSWSSFTDTGTVGYNIYRDGVLIGTTVDTNYIDTQIADSYIYHYTVRAYDLNNSLSQESSPLLVATDQAAPTVPQNLMLVTKTDKSINFSWDASADNVGVVGYIIFRNGIQIATTTGANFNDTGLTQNTTYTYTVVAYDAAGNESAPSDVFSVKTVQSSGIDSNGFKWSSDGTSVTITGYSGSNNAITIPSTEIVDGVSKPVLSIGTQAFSSSPITEVTIPNGITTIGDFAFLYSSLSSVTIPSSVINFGNWVFYRCGSLKTVNCDEGLTIIGDSAFAYCVSLSKINLPNSLKKIGDNAFENCGSLQTITIPGSAEISAEAFYSSGLTSVTLQEGIKSTGEFAFYDCSKLVSVNLPSSLTQIAWYTFNGCTSLNSITIPSNVTSIGQNAFAGCTNLTSVTNFCYASSFGSGVFSGHPSNLTLHAFGRSTTDTYATNNSINFAALALTSIEMQSNPTKTNYEVGESLDLTDATIKLTYTTGDTQIMPLYPNICDITTFTSSGQQHINVKLGNCSTGFDVTVTNPVTGITQLPSTMILGLNSSQKLNVLTNESADDKTILWSSSDNSIVTTDNNGNITALNTGTAVITAMSANGEYSTSCTVTVNVFNVVSVAIQPTNTTLFIGETLTLGAIVFPDNAANKGLTWSTSNNNIVSVNSNGAVTAKSVGSAKITVTTNDGNKTASCNITVINPVTNITILGSNDLVVGNSARLIASVQPTNATLQSVVWVSSNPSIVSIDQNGNVKGISAGTTTIIANATDGSGVTTVFNITILPPQIPTVTPTSIDVSNYTDMFAAALASYQNAKANQVSAQTNLNTSIPNLATIQQEAANFAIQLLEEQAKMALIQKMIEVTIAYIEELSKQPGASGAVLGEAFVLIDEECQMLDEVENIIAIEGDISQETRAAASVEETVEELDSVLAQAECDEAYAESIISGIAPEAVSSLENAGITIDRYADFGIIDEISARAAGNALDEGITSDTIKLLVDQGINPIRFAELRIVDEASAEAVAETLETASAYEIELSSLPNFMNSVSSVVEENGLTMSEFNTLRSESADLLTNAEKTSMKAIRDSIPMPTNDTLMQKVIPQGDIAKYLSGEFTQVGGYVTRAQDVTQLGNYNDIYNSLRLDYSGSAYNPTTDECVGVIKFKTPQASEIDIPYSDAMGGDSVDGYPFTGNGFTAANNGQVIPEYTCNDKYLNIDDGAELFTVEKDGTETLTAVYDSYLGKFVEVSN